MLSEVTSFGRHIFIRPVGVLPAESDEVGEGQVPAVVLAVLLLQLLYVAGRVAIVPPSPPSHSRTSSTR
jgi:hypothetical protein